MHTHYSTEVFDVLQTYCGLPVLERLLNNPADTDVIKMTLTAKDSAAPCNDPRFVIWEMIALELQADDSQASRWSSNEFVHLQVTTDGPKHKCVLMATMIEWWLAQLMSTLDYDELVFFLTYCTAPISPPSTSVTCSSAPFIGCLDAAWVARTRWCTESSMFGPWHCFILNLLAAMHGTFKIMYIPFGPFKQCHVYKVIN